MTVPGTLIHPQIGRDAVSLLARSIRLHLGLIPAAPHDEPVLVMKARRIGLTSVAREAAAESAARNRCFVRIWKPRAVGKTEAFVERDLFAHGAPFARHWYVA